MNRTFGRRAGAPWRPALAARAVVATADPMNSRRVSLCGMRACYTAGQAADRVGALIHAVVSTVTAKSALTGGLNESEDDHPAVDSVSGRAASDRGLCRWIHPPTAVQWCTTRSTSAYTTTRSLACSAAAEAPMTRPAIPRATRRSL